MNSKTHVAVLCGGQSAEHEVSIQSAKNIIQALNPDKYHISVIVVGRDGAWILLDSPQPVLDNPDYCPLPEPIAGARLVLNLGGAQPLLLKQPERALAVDVMFPILHGSHGEDGTLQGLLELANIPYVGAGVLGSAVSMDKEVTKLLLQAAGLPVAKWLVGNDLTLPQLSYERVVAELGLPLFVKPANTGSSVGVSKVKDRATFEHAVALARRYDHKILFEAYIPGREIECAVLGNDVVEVSSPGEIIPTHEFYSYTAKYLDPNGARLAIPAELAADVAARITDIAKRAFSALQCEGMARVDCFLTPDGQVVVNEANTLPGFTQISMYPQLWGVSGLSYSALLDRLLELALQRFARNQILVTQRDVALQQGQ